MRLKLFFILFVIFIFSLILRIWNLNEMGRTWDEELYLEWGYSFIELIKERDFLNPYWYETSGSPPVSRYLYGFASMWDIERSDSFNKPIFTYDFTYARLISVFLSSSTVVLVTLMGYVYFTPFIGIAAGVILGLLPLFIGYSQLATLESLIIFFFTAAVFAFISLLTRFSKKKMFLTGILLGLSLGVKYTNVILFPLILWIYLIWYFYNKKNWKTFISYSKIIIAVFAIALITFFVIWPMPWFHLSEVLKYNAQLRYSPYSVPEVFFGKLLLVPKVYYLVYFLITTPSVILIFFLAGLLFISNKRISYFDPRTVINGLIVFIKKGSLNFSSKKVIGGVRNFFLIANSKHKTITDSSQKWVQYALVAWFSVPFIQSLYNFKQHGIRYIIEIYAPLSLVSAIGLAFVLSRFGKTLKIKIIALTFLIIYMFVIIKNITPYYLDYFSEIVGGTNKVYQKQLFQMGWWGQGAREAGEYLEKNAQHGSTVGLAIMPIEVMPLLEKLQVSKYDPHKIYDYVVVSYFNVIREGFDDSNIRKNYKLVYQVKADRATLVFVYKHL